MNRRGFLAGIGALVGGIALEKAIPFGRVWSFPKEIKCLNAASQTASGIIAMNMQAHHRIAESILTVAATIEQYADFSSCKEFMIHPFLYEDLMKEAGIK